MNPDRKRAFILCIDVEPDEREVRTTGQEGWSGFVTTFESLRDLRKKLRPITGLEVFFNWFLRFDPQIEHSFGSKNWIMENYRALVDEMEEAGDEIGVHAHPLRWEDSDQHWANDFENQEWIQHCVESSLAAFASTFNKKAESFRFGDHWMNNETIALLERHGVKYDLTTEPGHKEKKGPMPDYSNLPRRPYQPTKESFLQPGGPDQRNIWIIPVSTSKVKWRIFRKYPFLKNGAITLNFGYGNYRISNVLKDALQRDEEIPIVATLRAGDISHPLYGHNISNNLRDLIVWSTKYNFEFVRPADSIARFANQDINN